MKQNTTPLMSELILNDRVPTDEEVQIIKDWLQKQPHLPIIMDESWIKSFINACQYNLDYTKKTIDTFCSLRHNTADLFVIKRDPLSPEIKNAFEVSDTIILPRLTPQNYRVTLGTLRDPNPDHYDFVNVLKANVLIHDTVMLEQTKLSPGEVFILDFTGVVLKHLTKISFYHMKKYLQYVQEAQPILIREIHFINCPVYMDKLFAVSKPFLKSEILKLIHFHTPNSDTLYKHIPLEILPEEYGGQSGKFDDIRRDLLDKVNSHRDIFLNEELWKMKGDYVSNSKGHMEGTFRSLAID